MKKYLTILHCCATALVVATALACSSSSFTSANQTGAKKSASDKNSQDVNKANDGLGNTGDLGNSSPGSNNNNNDLGNSSTPAELDKCLSSKADNYNIVLIFDNSGSQLSTDPLAVRRDGAMGFVDSFTAYAENHKTGMVNFAVLSFSSQSTRISNGWVTLNAQSVSTLKNNIVTATSNPSGGTVYSPPLRDAADLFGLLMPRLTNKKNKNYVVFLTDGLPNAAPAAFPLFGSLPMQAETMQDISNSVMALVNTYDVAVIAIASGTGIPASGESITSALAQPTVGVRDSSHVGIYHRAVTGDDLRNVWQNLMANIGNCNNN